MDLEKLKYPIGQCNPDKNPSANLIESWIIDIEEFPKNVRDAIEGAGVDQLNWRYRPGGWTVKQVIHHCSDSHLNSIIRFKWTLTEDTPVIKPYEESLWAELPDSLSDDVEMSLSLLDSLHRKWTYLLKNLSEEDLKREFIHPATNKRVSVAENIGIYSWHCNHHLEHIRNGLASKGAFS